MPYKSRAVLEILLDENGNVVGERVYINKSCLVGGYCQGPYYNYNTFDVAQDAETHRITVKWDLMNGFTGSAAAGADIWKDELSKGPLPLGMDGRTLALAYTTGRAASHAIPTINGEMTLAPTNGIWFKVESLSRDPYPSLGVYQYYGNETSTKLEHREIWGFLGPLWGLSPFSARDTVP
jgi:hypothetical protein